MTFLVLQFAFGFLAAGFALLAACLELFSQVSGESGEKWLGKRITAIVSSVDQRALHELPRLVIRKLVEYSVLRSEKEQRLIPFNKALPVNVNGMGMIKWIVSALLFVLFPFYILQQVLGWTGSALAVITFVIVTLGYCLAVMHVNRKSWLASAENTGLYQHNFHTLLIIFFVFLGLVGLSAMIKMSDAGLVECFIVSIIAVPIFFCAASVLAIFQISVNDRNAFLLDGRQLSMVVFAGALSFMLTSASFLLGRIIVNDAPVPQSIPMFLTNALFDALTMYTTLFLLTKTINYGKYVNGPSEENLCFDSDRKLLSMARKEANDDKKAIAPEWESTGESIWKDGARYGLHYRVDSFRKLSLPTAFLLDIAFAALYAVCALVLGVALTKGQSVSFDIATGMLLGLSADSKEFSLGPYFWVMHTTFIPTMIYLVIIALLVVLKCTLLPLARTLGWVGEHDNPVTLLAGSMKVAATLCTLFAVVAVAYSMLTKH